MQVLLKYNLQRGVPVIPKASFRKHLEENLVGMFDWKLSNQQKVSRPYTFVFKRRLSLCFRCSNAI